MDVNQVSQTLSNAFSIIIVVSMILAVGFGILGGLAWIYLWVGKWLAKVLKQNYTDAMNVFDAKPKRQAVKG